jgi:hypothetical protein
VATSDYSHLNAQELEKMLKLDMVDLRRMIEDIISAMKKHDPALDELQRIGAAVVGMLACIPAKSHVLVAAVTMEMLIQERGRAAK